MSSITLSLHAFHVSRRTCLVSSLHTSCSRNASSRVKKPGPSTAPSRTRLVKDLKPKSKSSGGLEVAPSPSGDKSTPADSAALQGTSSSGRKARSKGSIAEVPPPRPAFTRDSLPHKGLAPRREGSGRPLRRKSAEPLLDIPPITSPSPALSLKHWAARAHTERTERRAAERRRPRATVNPLGNEFDASKLESTDALPDQFTSPPLLEGLLTCLKEILPPNPKPTPIQALSLKHLFKPKESDNAWRQFLLASETGSGKSIAYLLPVLQDLKQSENDPRPSPQKRAVNPRALILAPTHELSRQLASFAKSLLHVSKLRVICASRANISSAPRKSRTASKMAMDFTVSELGEDSSEFEIRKGGRSRPVDVLVGTPNKVLEMAKGRGWDWEEREKDRLEQEAEDGHDVDDKNKKRTFWTAAPEMGLASIEWVIVDEADVLFDPDFQESTRMLLSDIALARGHSIPFEMQTELNPEISPRPIKYPFNLLLTTATIPSSLASYLDNYHPDLIRLASPNLHHLPRSLKTEYIGWTGGNRNSDVESRVRRVWAEDSLRGTDGQRGTLSKVLIFCNKRSKVEDLSTFLEEKGIKNVALTGTAESRKRGTNHHLDGFLKVKTKALALPSGKASAGIPATLVVDAKDPKKTPHVMITTSLLSRGLDFSPDIKHVFIVDEPRNMIDFLHRAGRSGRAGQKGKVVVFGKMSGRGSGLAKEIRKKVGALKA